MLLLQSNPAFNKFRSENNLLKKEVVRLEQVLAGVSGKSGEGGGGGGGVEPGDVEMGNFFREGWEKRTASSLVVRGPRGIDITRQESVTN